MSPSYCRRCLDAAASWHPEKSVPSKGGSHFMEAPTFCSPLSGSASPKCSRCAKNNKPCEVLARGDRPILVNLFAFLAAGQFPKTKAEYLESPSVLAVRTPARRLLHRLKFGDEIVRAPSSAADAAREASKAAARAKLMELTALQVQIDIANHLRCLTQHMLSSVRGTDVAPCYTMPKRVGPDTVPAELNFTGSDDEEEEE
ncbi:hypothetical protein EDB80DRAFT_271362 [Ilyonectria destructans]|nr:hypothetical protein EDB80DRAFT_271362 [Ilyonectria destructans]